ncbi:AEC family transporter [Amorphus orientalis]|uniref:Permease n=1 Tax=Amorphus orientalis TaxID=649198 RepID=A0AAE4AUK6_9HYPH|nr:AEC family transporter [Amorphus orientalis]MDQ0315929.1 putative permease [Amorphus orientalis]
MQDVLSLAFPFFGLIFLGYGAGKISKLPADGLAWLNFFVIYLALPALFFQLLSETPIEQIGSWSFIASTTLVTFVMFVLAFAVGIARSRGDVPVATIQGIIGSYSNVGYLGPGLTLAALGPAATVPTALIFCFDSALLFIIVPILMAVAAKEGQSALRTAAMIVKRIFTHPFILATLAGIAAAAFEFQPPDALDRLLTMLRGAAAPCALFAIGVTVSSRPLHRVPPELPALLAIKLVVHPLVIFLVLGWVGDIDPLWMATAVLMAGLPPATNAFVLASQYQVYVERASAAVLIGTVVSVATVTALLYLVTHDLLPFHIF